MQQEVHVIGSGFSSLSAACNLAHAGFKVSVYEKNATLGGRASQWKNAGFKFDMGPTWYWMPDVFNRFFADVNKKASDYYQIEKLNPGYEVYFGPQDSIKISDVAENIMATFEAIEPGSGKKLRAFLDKAAQNYEIAIQDLVYKPGQSIFELVTPQTIKELPQFYLTIRDVVHKNFKNPKLRQVLEFPVLFLGAKPENTPAFYSFMNHADFGLGTWYPKGGMKSVVDGMVKLAEELGVVFHANSEVTQFHIDTNNRIDWFEINGSEKISTSCVVSGADYKHTEDLLPKAYQQYSEAYWDKRTLAPSSLLFYVGFDKPVANVEHHTLFFDSSFDVHAKDIYDTPRWPDNPLFYASFPSKTDHTVAPSGKEAAVFLIPLAPDLNDTEALREQYFQKIMTRLELLTQQKLQDAVLFKRSYCVNDFKKDYHSYKGNAYGLANTLLQTAVLRPRLKSKKLGNLYFTGQLTVPGPGVPPALISGKIVSDLITKNYESTL